MERDNATNARFPPLFDLRAVGTRCGAGGPRGGGDRRSHCACRALYPCHKPDYTATASMLVDTRDSRAVNFNNVLPGIGADSAAIASQVNVIRSQELLNTVFDEQHIAKDPELCRPRPRISGLLSAIPRRAR